MALKINTVLPDSLNKRGEVVLIGQNPNDMVQLEFDMKNLTGNETENQAIELAKDRAKQLLQEALALL
jgi:hypothetical protein